MEEPKIIIKRPRDCSKDEQLSFKHLVVEGGQVKPEGLDRKISECKFLGFCYVGNELASIAAIKTKDESYFNGLCEKASAELPDKSPTLELGYCFTNHHHRGKKYNSRVNDALLEKIKGHEVFATTAHDSMHSYFVIRNFKKVGKPYDGTYNKGIVLYLKNSK